MPTTYRPAALNRALVGLEAVQGTPPAAYRWFRNINWSINPRLETNEDRPEGGMWPVGYTLSQEDTRGRYRGSGSFTELMDVLAMMCGAPTTTTPGGGVTSRQHEFNVDMWAPAAVKTASIEEGSSVRAGRASAVFATDMNLTWTKQRFEVGGGLIGQQWADGVTMTTAGLTARPYAPALGNQTRVYAKIGNGVTFPTMGTPEKLGGVARAEFKLTNMQAPFFALDADQPSWDNMVRTTPQGEFELRANADSTGMQWLSALRQGDYWYIRVETKGPLIEGTIYYLVQLDFAVQVQGNADFATDQQATVMPWRLRVVHHDTWGMAFAARLINKETAL